MNPQPIPEKLARQIREQLARGGKLPPGVIAVPQGQMPPPGAVPTGIQTSGVNTGNFQQMGMPSNPLPPGAEGLKVLRGSSQCPIPEESQKMNQLLSALMQAETEDDSVEQAMAKGLVVALRANRFCNKNLKTRTVCIFADDERLKKLHEDFTATVEEAKELEVKLAAAVAKANKLHDERWLRAVDTYGLIIEKRFYRIDEEKGIIEQVDLDCVQCKGSTMIRKARQETAELVLKLNNKGVNNDRTRNEQPSGPAASAGENSPQEQEVSGVADHADPDVRPGASGPSEAT